MTHSPSAAAVTDLDAEMAGAPAGAAGALWRLTGAQRGLDANLVRLGPGGVIAEHTEPTLDVLMIVVQGSGRVTTGEETRPLTLHSAAWLAKGSRRSLTAGPDGMTYLTVHTRRPGLGVTPASPEGGEAACLLQRVCPDCGRLAADRDARYCARCGSPLPD
ncbi:hypothetical protein AS594_32300 [Streptomyces agglomeratus]|uniref:Cupin 2 conserved barrel domain-containing protein n=1 Tax=Streptomyces agglomeratus TaxID=285458 RepID=A0A1E5PG20_9ACTN|nr:hypothetical protein [Streptomyces agglomeratus]OEJ28472.1 hypothetical protein AS594_32300 [Streptomyces agglomeratus]OEJ50007.1 hypothetical protein BGK72_03775 [Streptomyces agglomeratus]